LGTFVKSAQKAACGRAAALREKAPKKRAKYRWTFENKDALFIGLCTGVFGHFFLTVGVLGPFS